MLAGSPQAWIWVVPGLLIGLGFGALPGASSAIESGAWLRVLR
jgi:putative tricarboxylic transport membrane protein